jgi:hypothetical protein
MAGLFDQVVNYSPPLLTAGQVNYKGTWNASTNSPTLLTPPAATSKGDYYVVSAAGTQFTISFAVGDWIISNGAAWEKVDLTDAVSSVHGRTGAVVGVSTDYSAVGLNNTAIGATTASTGAFTTLTASSSAVIAGGAAIGQAAFQASGNQASQLIANLTSSISGAGTSFGLRVAAGTNASDYALRVSNQAGTLDYLFVKGDGAVSMSNGLAVTGAISAASLTSPAASNLTLGTGSFGTALTFTSATGAATFAGRTLVGSATGTLGSRFEVNELSDTIAFFVRGSGQLNGVGIGSSGTNQGFINGYSNAAAVASLGIQVNGGALSIGNSGTVTTINGTTASTSTTTGSLVNAGGFGNAGAAYFGSTITASGVIASSTGLTATSGNALQVNNSLNDAAATIFNSGTTGASVINFRTASTTRLTIADTVATFTTSVRSTSATGGIGYATGAGGAVTQGTSRTTGVTLNNVCGAITLFTAAGSATWQSFTVTNSAVAATDTIIVNQRSGTDLYMISVTAVGAGSFRISYATTGGTTSEAPIFNFSVIKAVSS